MTHILGQYELVSLGERMVKSARAYVDTPFFHAGRSVYGLDCVGLLVLAAKDAGVEVHDETSYSPFINADYLKSRIDMVCRELTLGEEPQVGDLVLFRVSRSPQHMALITGLNPTTIIHAYQTIGRVIEHELDAHWNKRIAGYYRLTVGGAE